MLLKRFWRNRDGGVGPVLALSALPLFGVVGAAIDYGRVATVRTEMQNSLDATALMLSKEAQGMSGADIGTKASAYFNALFTNPQATNIQITEEFGSPQEGNFSLKIRGSATVNTLFARLFGQSAITFSASTEVLWGIKKLNLALVLDNTGSMAQNQKMTNLKAAAHNLLTTLKNAAKQPGDVKVAIVPFATDVNVGKSNVNASWIDWTDWEAANGTCSKSTYKSKSTCQANRGVWTPKNHSNWNGCVMDRDQNNDVSNTVPVAGSPATLFRAHQASACPASSSARSSRSPCPSRARTPPS